MEIFLSVVIAPYCCGYYSALRSVHFPAVQLDHGTALAFWLAFLGCQSSFGIVPNGPINSNLGSLNACYGLKFWHVPLILT